MENNMKKLIFILLIISNGIQAAPLGNGFTYQGELIESGQPATGVYTFNVHFYDSPVNGFLIDSNLNITTNVENGLFNLDLDISDGPFQGAEIWIELELVIFIRGVGTNETLLPRQLITNAPYAIQSKYVGDGGVSTLSINNNAVTTSKLADSSITNSKMAVSSVNSSNIINETIDTDDIKNGTIMAVDVNSSSIQQRITGTCSAGSSIRSIDESGMVTCEPDSVGNSGWELTGNSGTNSATNFIGTTDNQPVIVKVNNKQVIKIGEANNQMPGLNHMNVVLGSVGSSIDQFAGSKLENAMILGGSNNAVLTLTASDSSVNSVVVGGNGNFIKDANEAIIVGGANSVINKLGYRSAIVAGAGNSINSSYSFASGFGSRVDHDGGWVWNDQSSFNTADSYATTAENQFIIRAEGGFGLGTNAPASQMHIKGQGRTFGVLMDEVVLTVEPKQTTGDVSLAINRLDSTKESALAFTTNKSPDFDVRSVNGSALDFNSYESGSASFMMRINDSITNRIDFNTNLEPQSDNIFDIGSSSFKFANMYATTMIANNFAQTSDRRLKENINNLNYGLSEILNIKPVSYQMINDGKDTVHLGLIAQEVELIIPEIVNKADDKNQTRSMRYAELVPVLIKATQEQQMLIDQQNKQIIELQLLVNKLIKKDSKKRSL